MRKTILNNIFTMIGGAVALGGFLWAIYMMILVLYVVMNG